MDSKVYSYMRFSAAKQAAGASMSRQTDYAKRWAAEHGLQLDESLSMRDEGLSAYHQRHVKSGALGVFLAAINAGRIPPGSVLIVEGLDRLSRAEPILAQAQLAQIINADITVVTASDGKQYNREGLKANPMDLVYSLLVMIRAHEESETKSKRLADVLRRRCEGWVAGTYRGKISCGADPSWIRWEDGKPELIPEITDSVRYIVRRFVAGYGGQRIIHELRERGMKSPGLSQPGNINQLVNCSNWLLIGTRKVVASGVEFTLEGYYPPVLSESEYAALLTAVEARRTAPRTNGGKTKVPSIITGYGITSCGRCGGFLNARNNKTDGKTYRRLVCVRCELEGIAGDRTGKASCTVNVVEKALLDYCSDQINLESIMGVPHDDPRGVLTAERDSLTLKIAETSAAIERMMDAALATGGEIPQVLLRRIRAAEDELVAMNHRKEVIAAELLTTPAHKPVDISPWVELKGRALALDFDARMALRKLARESFSAIQVYFRGAYPGTPENIIDMMLVSKTGVSRLLRIDRKTGEFVSGLNLDQHRGQ